MDTKASKNQKQTFKPVGKRSAKEQDEINVSITQTKNKKPHAYSKNNNYSKNKK